MMGFFSKTERRKVAERLARIGMGPGKPSQETTFKLLAILVVSDVSKGNNLAHYLQVLSKTASTP